MKKITFLVLLSLSLRLHAGIVNLNVTGGSSSSGLANTNQIAPGTNVIFNTNAGVITISSAGVANGDLIILSNGVVGWVQGQQYVSPSVLVVLSNGVVGWVNSQQYVSALQTNVVLSSKQITLFTTNAFVFSGSNYVGRFEQLYSWTLTTPWVGGGGLSLPTNQTEDVWVSESGTNGWYLATNGIPIFTNVSVAIVGAAGGFGSCILYGLDHPEVFGRTNSADGQQWLIKGSPIASLADIAATVHVLHPPVQLAGSWLFDSQAPTTTNMTVSFTLFSEPIFQLLGSADGVHIDSATRAGTNCLLLVNQTNLVTGWLVEQCTNLAAPVIWKLFTNYTQTTNSGVLTLTVPLNLALPAQFFLIRGIASASATFFVPLSLNAGELYASNQWSLVYLTNQMSNFSFWRGSSNGQAMITLYLSNGVAYIKRDFP
jgi:hypothetical protein